MSKKSDMVEFKWLEAKPSGSSIVVFQLEDGAQVKIRVEINRAGVALNYKNPDGTPHYNIGAGLHITVIPSDKKFYMPKSRLKKQPTAPPKKEQPYI